jgi:hypothetical protein
MPNRHLGRTPPRWVLVGLLFLSVAPPFFARACGTSVGAFSMFSRMERHHLEIELVGASGVRPLALERLRPHLSRDARQIVLPAAGYPLGADQVDLLAGGLDDLARLACELDTGATAARVRFYRGAPGATELTPMRTELPCPAR